MVIDFSVKAPSRHLICASCSWSLKAKAAIRMLEGNLGALWSTLTAWDGGKPLRLNLFGSARTAESSDRRKHLQPQINRFCSLGLALGLFIETIISEPPTGSAYLPINRQLGKGAQGSPVWRL